MNLRFFRSNRRGSSSIIVVVLGLVILVTIVSNIVLWSYELNNLDWEKMKEEIDIVNVAGVAAQSSWFTSQNEYTVNNGSLVSGDYIDTHADDDQYERFQETPLGGSPSTFNIKGNFVIDTSIYPLTTIQYVEVQLKYNASDSREKWFLRAYDWSGATYSDNGFNSTGGHTPTTEWDYYTVNFTNQWSNYVHNNGTIYVKIVDEGVDGNQTVIDVDFLGVRVKTRWTQFTFYNDGSFTCHLVSLWVNNSTHHNRCDIDVYVNAATTKNYTLKDMSLPNLPYTVKIITERGNVAVHHEN